MDELGCNGIKNAKVKKIYKIMTQIGNNQYYMPVMHADDANIFSRTTHTEIIRK